MTSAIRVLALLVLSATVALAQDHATMHPTTVPIGTVNGERVPDAVAYRLYFIHVSQLPGNLQTAQLKKVMLSSEDSVILTNSLAGFKDKYLNLVEAFNAEAAVAELNGKLPNFTAHHTAIAKLVDETTQNLFASLSSAGVGKFTGYVKSEKINMRISESEAQ
ncbi:MAG TPA: hypothetical protein VIX91_10905 [Candidatus Acidoferrum sp.]